MGTPMVERLLAAGHEVTALGRSAEKRTALAELGAATVSAAPDVAAGADVVIVCVFTDEQVRELCSDSPAGNGLLAAMRPGSVLVVHTTGSPQTAATLAEAGAARDVGVLDAPVSGGPHDIAAGTLTLYLGGTEDAVAKARPALASYGDPVVHVGPVGSGQKMKLINNALFAAQIGLVAEATKLAERLGIDESAALDALPHGSGASRAMGNIARAGSAAKFIAAVGEFIGKDVAVVRRTTAELGADLGRLDPLVDAGLGH